MGRRFFRSASKITVICRTVGWFWYRTARRHSALGGTNRQECHRARRCLSRSGRSWALAWIASSGIGCLEEQALYLDPLYIRLRQKPTHLLELIGYPAGNPRDFPQESARQIRLNSIEGRTRLSQERNKFVEVARPERRKCLLETACCCQSSCQYSQ